MLKRLIGIALALGVANAHSIAYSAVTIWNVAVVDPATGGTQPTMLVEVDDGRIQAVEPAGENPPSAAETVVDGTGKFLMPGLWDNHVHLSKLGPSSLPLFVAHGVTSVRDMGQRPL